MKFSALVVMSLISWNTFAAGKVITGKEAIRDLNYFADNSFEVDGTDTLRRKCFINIDKNKSDGSLLLKISNEDNSTFVVINPGDVVKKSSKGDSAWDQTVYKLPKGYVSITTYEDITNMDLEISSTGKKQDAVNCFYME